MIRPVEVFRRNERGALVAIAHAEGNLREAIRRVVQQKVADYSAHVSAYSGRSGGFGYSRGKFSCRG